MVIIRRHHLPLGMVAGLFAAPLAVAYGIGRLGCFVAGDGTYGRPSGLPWAMAFPHGSVPVDVPVQPTALYEALLAIGLAALLWRLGRHAPPALVFAAYLIGSGLFRFLIEFLRTNRPVAFDLTAPRLWSMALVAVGAVLIILARCTRTSNGQKVPLAS